MRFVERILTILRSQAGHIVNPGGGGGGSGTVTSVAATVPGGFSISGSPITTSGTFAITASGTSGGILYYSSTTTTASSGILNTNLLVKGGGAGGAPTNSLATDDGTTLTYTGTGGASVDHLVTTGAATTSNFTAIVAPGTPAAGVANIYVDSTTKVFSNKDDAGAVSQTFRAQAAVSNQWIASLPASGIPTITQPAFTNISGSVAASQMPALTGDVTTSAGAVATTLGASYKIRGLVFVIGDPAGSALSAASTTTAYMTVPFACTIAAYNLAVDAGTITVKFWKVATGVAIPTVGNVINTSGVAISANTAIHSTTVTDFTTTTVAANDIMAMNVTAVATAKYVSATLQCNLA